MAPLTAVLAAFLLASAALAKPVVTINHSVVSVPFLKRMNHTDLRGIASRDRGRAKSLKTGVKKGPFKHNSVVSVSSTNAAVTYLATVSVGSPATPYTLIVDTGSSNTWIGSGKKYKKTSTGTDTGHKVAVSYGSGSFSGEEFTDRVAFGPSLVISKQSIGVASTSSGFDGVDGILGVGPADLTTGTVTGVNTVATVTDNLFSQKTISTNSLAISFKPTTVATSVNGELTFGGTDSSKFTGNITYTPITKTAPASEYWGINQSVNYGTTSTSILKTTGGIVDTGTTLILLATDAFIKYQHATGAVMDAQTGLLRVTAAQYKAMKNLNFVIGGTTFALTPNAQIWPRSLNPAIGGTAGNIYLVVADLGSDSGEGLDFVNGMGFLERFYSVFDTGNKRVGFAKTPQTNATTN